MQENLAQLVFWGHCPSLSFPLSFAPQGCSLCSHRSLQVPPPPSSPAQSQSHPVPIAWPKEGEMPKGSQQQEGQIQQSSHHPVPFHSQGILSPLGQGLCAGGQAGTRSLALDPTWLWGAAGAGITPQRQPSCLFCLGKGKLCSGKRGFIPCWLLKQKLL